MNRFCRPFATGLKTSEWKHLRRCATHYQYLAEQRALISRELRQLDALLAENAEDGIEEFIRRSSFVDDETVRAVRGERRR